MPRSCLVAATVVVITAAAAVPQARAQAPSPTLHLLDVPYLPQSEALCGGAAAAMVMRYWGAAGVYAETFAELVDHDAGGIRADDLIESLRSRRWNARSFAGDATIVRSHLAAGRPVIALIEDRPGRFHYVVLVGWAAGRVILHDPARAPFRVLDEAPFVELWRASGFWTLLALPTTPVPAAGAATPTPTRATGSCARMVDEGIRLAGAGDAAAARRLFQAAVAACPSDSAPVRELAGLHALQNDWAAAVGYARDAVRRDPADQHAWRILATSRFLTDDFEGALAAWNQVGEPSIDLLNVTGLERVRYDVVARATGIEARHLLTPGTFRAARQRLSELPAASTTRVAYRPREDGTAIVDAVMIERPLLPVSTAALAVAAVRAVSDREARFSVATPSGGGELWTASWRWWERRPRVSLGFATPAPFGGIWRVEVFDERQAYAVSGGEVREARRGATFSASHWTHLGLRWEATAGIDRWDRASTSATFGGSLQQHLAGERLTLEGHAIASVGTPGLAAGSGGEWRSAPRHEGTVWLARAGLELASAESPLAFWPGAGTGQGRSVLLRAHPLLDDGRIDGVFGQRLGHGGVEWRQWLRPALKVIRFAPAVFVDTARAWRGLQESDMRWHVDAGAGLRVAAPGAGVIRLDLARGLRDGNTTVSIGWTR